MVDPICFVFQRKWYRNFLMKGFHLVVLLTAGPGIRDTQVVFWNIYVLHLVFVLTVAQMPNSLCNFCSDIDTEIT